MFSRLSHFEVAYLCSCIPPDQFDKVKKYYQLSQQAEERCNASVLFPTSPVEQSKQNRGITEKMLNATKDELLRNLTAHNNSLNELHQKTQNLSETVRHLSQMVNSADTQEEVDNQKNYQKTPTFSFRYPVLHETD